MNTLEQIRKKRGLTYQQMAELTNYKRNSVWQHCHRKEYPPGDAAIRYSRVLNIPLEELRPDLFAN